MSRNTTDKELLAGSSDMAMPRATWTRIVTRADGKVEAVKFDEANQMLAAGLTAMAARMVADATSPFVFLAIGTVTAAASLGSVEIGEVERKIGSTATSSKEALVIAATWAGNADTLTSVDLRTAAVCNHVSSGQGTFLNAINSVATILGDSDHLLLQCDVQVGSHNL